MCRPQGLLKTIRFLTAPEICLPGIRHFLCCSGRFFSRCHGFRHQRPLPLARCGHVEDHFRHKVLSVGDHEGFRRVCFADCVQHPDKQSDVFVVHCLKQGKNRCRDRKADGSDIRSLTFFMTLTAARGSDSRTAVLFFRRKLTAQFFEKRFSAVLPAVQRKKNRRRERKPPCSCQNMLDNTAGFFYNNIL